VTGAQSADARRAAGAAAALVPEPLPRVSVTRHDMVQRQQPAAQLAEAEQSRWGERSVSGRSQLLIREATCAACSALHRAQLLCEPSY